MRYSTTLKCFKIQPVFTRTYAQSPLTSNCLTYLRLTSPATAAGGIPHPRQRHTLCQCRSSLQHGIVAWRGIYLHLRWMERDLALVLWCCRSPLIGMYALNILLMHKLTFDDTARSTHAVQYFLQRPRPSTPFGRVHPRSGWTVTYAERPSYTALV